MILSNKSLKKGISLDGYISNIARNHKDHKFLGSATQGVYRRQIRLIEEFYENQNQYSKNIKVLDWGTGKGHISYLMQKQGFSVTSCDVNSQTHDSTFGQHTPIIEDNGMDVIPLNHQWKLPFEDGEFDLVVSFGVLEHVDDDAKSLTEIRRVLRKGGVCFFFFLPFHLSWTQKIAHLRGNFYHDRLYSHKLISELAIGAGFQVGRIWHGQLFPKNSVRHSNSVEWLDRFICEHTALRYFATNLEGFLVAK